MSNIVPVQDIERMATAVAKSGLFGIKTPEQGVALMLIAQAEGMHPAIAARDYHVIQGRPALKADAMLARFQSSGGKVMWKVYEDAEVTGEFSHPQGGTVTITWTFAQAAKIGLTGKDNWRNYPRAMLRARVISEGIRTVYPGCVVGVYTPEEVEDFKDDKPSKPAKVKDMGMVHNITVPDGDGVIEITLPFYVPGNPDPYSNHTTVEEWMSAYAEIVAKLQNSTKISDAEKITKLEQLGECNMEMMKTFNGIQKAKLKATIVRSGGQVNPKLEVFLQSTEMEPSGEPS